MSKKPKEVSGNEIMEYAFSVIYRVQELIGGRVVFVECQDKPKLVDFYVSNGFKVFRQDPEDRLLQLVCLIK